MEWVILWRISRQTMTCYRCISTQNAMRMEPKYYVRCFTPDVLGTPPISLWHSFIPTSLVNRYVWRQVLKTAELEKLFHHVQNGLVILLEAH